MKPLTEHPNLERGKRGILIESLVELGVLATGLRHVSSDASFPLGISRDAGSLLSAVEDLQRALPSALVKASAAGHEFSFFGLPLVREGQVALGELAITVVAENEPGSTDSPSLQDPLQYEEANNMWVEYQAALAALDNPEPPAAPPHA